MTRKGPEHDGQGDGAVPPHDVDPIRTDWTGGVNPIVAIVEAVAAATGREARAAPSLSRCLNTEALNTLLTDSRDETEALRISFTCDGFRVLVGNDGTIEVDPTTEV